MAEKGWIGHSTLTAIANAIREKTGDTALLLPGAMAQAIGGISAGINGGKIVSGSITPASASAAITIPMTYQQIQEAFGGTIPGSVVAICYDQDFSYTMMNTVAFVMGAAVGPYKNGTAVPTYDNCGYYSTGDGKPCVYGHIVEDLILLSEQSGLQFSSGGALQKFSTGKTYVWALIEVV